MNLWSSKLKNLPFDNYEQLLQLRFQMRDWWEWTLQRLDSSLSTQNQNQNQNWDFEIIKMKNKILLAPFYEIWMDEEGEEEIWMRVLSSGGKNLFKDWSFIVVDDGIWSCRDLWRREEQNGNGMGLGCVELNFRVCIS